MYDKDTIRFPAAMSEIPGLLRSARVDYWAPKNESKRQVRFDNPYVYIDEEKKVACIGTLDASGQFKHGKDDFYEEIDISTENCEITLSGRPVNKKRGRNGAKYCFQFTVEKRFIIYFYVGEHNYDEGENPADTDAYEKKRQFWNQNDGTKASIGEMTEADFERPAEVDESIEDSVVPEAVGEQK
jgi:hypothetical protein